MRNHPRGANDLVIPFIFVPTGDPPPTEWLAAHPGAIRIPARFVRRPAAPPTEAPTLQCNLNQALQTWLAQQQTETANPPTPSATTGGSPIAPTKGTPGPDTTYISAEEALSAYLNANAVFESLGVVQPSTTGTSTAPLAPSPTADNDTQPKLWLASAQTEAKDPPKQQQPAAAPTATPAPKPMVIFIGGFGDSNRDIVKSYAADFANHHPNIEMKYFSYDQRADIIDFINKTPKNTHITIVGHSWGGDTAMEVTKATGGRVTTLITIDPVGHGGQKFVQDVKSQTSQWIDVSAGGKSKDFGNFLAALGRGYREHLDIPGIDFIKSDADHAEFEKMLNSVDPISGKTIADLIGGTGSN